ncbi:MAG: MliC family protein [Candidatus Paceibacterota bacterium]|jgi:membrane-bound inhibitor of C-type lysozyme
MFLYRKNSKWEDNTGPAVKALRLVLLVLIVVGLVLIFTKNLWVPKLVDYILQTKGQPEGVINAVTFNCQDEKAIDAIFFKDRAELTLNDGRHLLLNQAVSASGARYANRDESFVFWNKGDTAFITEKDPLASLGTSKTTFANCVLAENNQTGTVEQYFSQNLKTFVDDETGITFQYPDKILTKYIETVDWPPKVQELREPFSCVETGAETGRAGKTARQIINGQDYCVTKESEGAAGSIYTNYVYAFPYNNTTIIFTFSLRFVQCDNYDDPQKSACKQERSLFSPDNATDQMAESLSFQIQQ